SEPAWQHTPPELHRLSSPTTGLRPISYGATCQSASNSMSARWSSALPNSCWPTGRVNLELRRRPMTLDFSLSQVKITPRHLDRKAVISMRQSSPKQVREHLDSPLTQRTLIRRAEHLGWHSDRIDVFDGDLGQSAAGVQERDDLKALAPEVALGHVGMVFGWQVSRLARNNAAWYQLLDVAALVGTLIG